MSGADWLSYSLQDFLMFGPEVFLRLFVRINQAAWPWHLLLVPLALAVPWLLGRREPAWRRVALAVAAAAWIISGYGFLVRLFGEVNWPAAWFGWAFVVQGVGLTVLAAVKTCPRLPVHQAPTLSLLWALAILVLPWASVLQSGTGSAVAIFGLAPSTTVAASGLLLALAGRPAVCLLLPVPLLWLLFSAVTYWALQTYWLLVMPVTALVFIAVGLSLSPRRERSPDWQSVRRDPADR